MACSMWTKCAALVSALVFLALQGGLMFALLKTYFVQEPFVPAFISAAMVCLPFTFVVGVMVFLFLDRNRPRE